MQHFVGNSLLSTVNKQKFILLHVKQFIQIFHYYYYLRFLLLAIDIAVNCKLSQGVSHINTKNVVSHLVRVKSLGCSQLAVQLFIHFSP